MIAFQIMSPIERTWDVHGQRVGQHQNEPSNLQELAQVLTDKWDNINAPSRYSSFHIKFKVTDAAMLFFGQPVAIHSTSDIRISIYPECINNV